MNITGDCKNHIYQKITSPNQKLQIVKFDRGCGATVGNSIQLSLTKLTESLPDEAGNIFIAESLGSWDQSDSSVSIKWINDREVEVLYDSTLKIFKKEHLHLNVNISYNKTN
jgi:hypothetical protein